MKFLCVECDEPMRLLETRGPDEGTMAILFGCPTCEREIAMLTNSMETQMVRSLGVKIGGRAVPTEPMEMVTQSLAGQHEDLQAHPPVAPEPVASNDTKAGSKCPFTGMVNEAFEKASSDLIWTQEAEDRITRIPSFAQSMVRKSIEDHARGNGYTEINAEVMNEVKGMFGM